MNTRVIHLLVPLLFLCSVVRAQTLSEVLQHGIYMEETVGDLDAAVRSYRQVIAAAPPGGELRTRAQRRLQAVELRQQQVAAPSQAIYLRPNSSDTLGTVVGRFYRNLSTGLTFEVPDRWRVVGTSPSSDDGEMVELSLEHRPEIAFVWMKAEPNDAASIDRRLEESPSKKAQ